LNRNSKFKHFSPGEINKIPTPPPLPHEDPSINKAQGVISRKLIDESQCSVMKSAIICPLTAFADSNLNSNLDRAKIYLPILPFKIGIDNMCLITSNFEYTMHSAFNK
jgi:hypothetical protein